MSEYADQEKQCRDCQSTFLLSAGEQVYFVERQLTPPNRCKACRDKRRAERDGGQTQAAPTQRVAAPAIEYKPRQSQSRQAYETLPPDRLDKNGGRRRRKNHNYRDFEREDW